MLTGRRFVIWGLSRLAARVARALAAEHASVVVVRLRGEPDGAAPRLGPGVSIVEAGGEPDGEALARAGLAGAACLLALSEDDGEKLRAAVAARVAAPDVPTVLRAFDPLFADQLEQGGSVRRAYSVSALAAPAFVAAACGDGVLETLRLGEGEVPLCSLRVRAGSPLAGLMPAEVKARLGCAILARAADAGGEWRAVGGAGGALTAGEQVLLGGPRDLALGVAARNAPWAGRTVKTRRAHGGRRGRGGRAKAPTRLWPIALGLSLGLLASVFVFRAALGLRWVDAIYFVVTTATTTGYGDISLQHAPDWVKLFGCLVMLAGGALLGIVFSHLAAQATLERLDETQARRAGRMRGHIVVAGLGNLGYRVARQFSALGRDVAVIDLAPRPRFAQALRPRVPVLAGDASFPETLARAAIGHASAFLACSNDDLANIQACLHARRLNPGLTTVARLSDDALAEHLPRAFAIDRALSASEAAAGAFVGAATDTLALRTVRLGSLLFLAGRYAVSGVALSPETVAAWRASGVRVLAFRLAGGPVRPASELPPAPPPGTELILCGPAPAVRAAFG